jgi:hypothetical protein
MRSTPCFEFNGLARQSSSEGTPTTTVVGVPRFAKSVQELGSATRVGILGLSISCHQNQQRHICSAAEQLLLSLFLDSRTGFLVRGLVP